MLSLAVNNFADLITHAWPYNKPISPYTIGSYIINNLEQLAIDMLLGLDSGLQGTLFLIIGNCETTRLLFKKNLDYLLDQVTKTV